MKSSTLVRRFLPYYKKYGKTVAMGYITSTDKCYARNGGDYIYHAYAVGIRLEFILN